jgi:hypothetical protein
MFKQHEPMKIYIYNLRNYYCQIVAQKVSDEERPTSGGHVGEILEVVHQ